MSDEVTKFQDDNTGLWRRWRSVVSFAMNTASVLRHAIVKIIAMRRSSSGKSKTQSARARSGTQQTAKIWRIMCLLSPKTFMSFFLACESRRITNGFACIENLLFARLLRHIICVGCALFLIALPAGCDREMVVEWPTDSEFSDLIQTGWFLASFGDLLRIHGYEYHGGGARGFKSLWDAEQSIRMRAVGVACDKDKLLHLYYAAILDKLTIIGAEVYSSSGPVLNEVSHFEISYSYHGTGGHLRVLFSLDSAGYIDVNIENTEWLR